MKCELCFANIRMAEEQQMDEFTVTKKKKSVRNENECSPNVPINSNFMDCTFDLCVLICHCLQNYNKKVRYQLRSCSREMMKH